MASIEACRHCGHEFMVKGQRPALCPSRTCRRSLAGNPRGRPKGIHSQSRSKAVVSVAVVPEVIAVQVVAQAEAPAKPVRKLVEGRREVTIVRDEDVEWGGEGVGD